jgi:hypothetical protein
MTNVEIPNGLPTLSVGSHGRGSNRACIMNAISYLKGDTDITDYPDCVHPMLARAAQMVNDSVCNEPVKDLMGEEVLCPACAHQVWLIGARVMGTGRKELIDLLGVEALFNLELKWVETFVMYVECAFGTVFPGSDHDPETRLEQVLTYALSAAAIVTPEASTGAFEGEKPVIAVMYKLIELYEQIVDPAPRKTVKWSQETYETVVTEGKIPVYNK